MNNKGFSLTELIVTFAILGVILGVAFPSVERIHTDNNKQLYESYENAMKASAKLYVDQYDRDLWVKNTNGCVKINYNDLTSEDLIKTNANVGNTTEKTYRFRNNEIVSPNTSYVLARKNNNKVNYKVYLEVKINNEKIYSSNLASSESSGCKHCNIKTGVCS